VVNDSEEILVITERFSVSQKPLWKLPGGKTQMFLNANDLYWDSVSTFAQKGYVDPGENLDVAVVREVLEETGVKTELKSLVAFR
jgi:hypothetical protein